MQIASQKIAIFTYVLVLIIVPFPSAKFAPPMINVVMGSAIFKSVKKGKLPRYFFDTHPQLE
jgi:hypothetical protein